MFTFLLGASGIIGSAVERELKQENHHFISLDKRTSGRHEGAKNFTFIDMEDLKSIDKICDFIFSKREFKRINILNCAGYDSKPTVNDGGKYQVDKVMMINQIWPVEFIQKLIYKFKSSECLLNVVLLDTTYSKISPQPKNYMNGYIKPYEYIMSKAYTESFVKYLTVHHPQHKFNCIAPHLVVVDQEELKRGTKLLENGVVRRTCEPLEIASVICYLLDPRSDFIKGERLKVDGGWTA